MIVSEKPDVIVCIGDWVSLDSLSSYAAPGSKIEQNMPTLAEDIQASKAALDVLFQPLRELQARQKEAKHRPYRPYKVMVKGNHEQRFDRYMNKHPKLDKMINLDEELGFFSTELNGEHPWDVVQYKSSINIDGIDYTHIPHDGLGRPISGVNPARLAAMSAVRPIIFGHTHTFGAYSLPIFDGINGNGVRACFNIGSFMPDQHIEDYAKGNRTGWQYMVMRVFPSLRDNVAPDVETVQNWRLERLYG